MGRTVSLLSEELGSFVNTAFDGRASHQTYAEWKIIERRSTVESYGVRVSVHYLSCLQDLIQRKLTVTMGIEPSAPLGIQIFHCFSDPL
jgi:hypothetical protein